MTRLVIVEDHTMVRDALAAMLASIPEHEVVGVAGSLRTALPIIESSRPDIVLADLSLEDGLGTELVRAARRAHLKTRILIMTALRDRFAVQAALKSGIAGYLLKARPLSELVDAIAAVMNGQRYLSPTITATDADWAGDDQAPAATSGLQHLSPRETEIFRLVVDGCSSMEVARRLCISLKTVETHRNNINRKLAVRSTADLIRFAVSHGISLPGHQPSRGSGGES
ncbi:MAG TPA: response regulator transcription factor [Polyangia bacterium]|jgi:DNA-binding NarL/FixJ family response regulator|nr:response regulator transcription factor [Polyangia bacterium]